MSSRRVVVVGGGLAGIACALDCADAGADVVLLERRRRLGGLTWSTERNGIWFDNGQHVFLRCCTAYRSLLDRIGSSGDVVLQDRLDIPVLRPGGTEGRIRRSALVAPLHLAGALAGYRHLGAADKLRIARAAWALRRLDPADPGLDSLTFGDWLSRHGQRPSAIDALWELITLPTVNLPAAQASLALATKVFRTGLLDRSDAGDVGWSKLPLARLHGARSALALEAAGVEVALGEPVVHLDRAETPFTVSTARRLMAADAVVLAVPPDTASALIGPGVLPEVHRLGTSPVLNVHLVLDRKVTDVPFAAAIGSPVQFLFDRTESSGLAERRPGEQYLAVSLSAADEYLQLRSSALLSRFHQALAELFPRAGAAGVVDGLVTREPAATFRGVPGTSMFRPTEQTSVPGLFVAGAWCATGWPATMEGAARSGRDAARGVLAALEAGDRSRPLARPGARR